MENKDDETKKLNILNASEEFVSDLVEFKDVKGNDITIENSKVSLTLNSELIQMVIDGDPKAFNKLYLQSYRYTFFVIRQYIHDDETTYDAIQETFIKVYKNIHNLRDTTAYYGWLTSIAKNTAIDILRTKPDVSELVYEENNPDALKDEQVKEDVSLDIKSVLKEMNPDDAELLSLVYYDGMRISQIAKMQGVPKTTVYSRFNKAKKNLKAQLKVHGIDKAIYSGNFVGMITVGIRNIIGTSLLSWSIAQQILDSIVTKKDKKELSLARIILAQQKKTVLKIASCIAALSILTSAVTVLALLNWDNIKKENNINYLSKETSASYSNSSKEEMSVNSFVDDNNTKSSDGSSSNDENLIIDTSKNQDTSDIMDNSSSVSSNDFSGSDVNEPTIYYPEPLPSIQEDDHTINNEVINTVGNNPNNVMRTISGGVEVGGMVAKQGDWLYYVQGTSRLIKIKTDGSNMQVLYESSGQMTISSLNVIGDTIYYTNGGIWSMKTDGTDRKLISSKTAYNLLVRGTTGWYVDVVNTSDTPAIYVKYSLCQIDLLTGDVITIVENGSGFGLKTVIDDYLIYVNGNNVYKRDLSTGDEKIIKRFDFARGIYNMCVKGNTIYFCGGSTDERVLKIDINNPNVIIATYKFGRVYNYFNYAGGGVYGSKDGGASLFYTLSGDVLYEPNGSIIAEAGVYTFDDGFVYYYLNNLTELHCCFPDGTEYKTY